jgi:hypothetical protein
VNSLVLFYHQKNQLTCIDYGPTLYKNLGFSPVKQLLYPAGCLTAALGFNIIGAFVVDIFPRPKFMAVGVFGSQATLVVEAALIANFVPSNNKAALQAAVAMFYIFQVFYGVCNDGKFAFFPPWQMLHCETKY